MSNEHRISWRKLTKMTLAHFTSNMNSKDAPAMSVPELTGVSSAANFITVDK
jgi:hypothetical protein